MLGIIFWQVKRSKQPVEETLTLKKDEQRDFSILWVSENAYFLREPKGGQHLYSESVETESTILGLGCCLRLLMADTGGSSSCPSIDNSRWWW